MIIIGKREEQQNSVYAAISENRKEKQYTSGKHGEKSQTIKTRKKLVSQYERLKAYTSVFYCSGINRRLNAKNQNLSRFCGYTKE